MTDLDLPTDSRVAVFSLDAGRSLLGRVCERLGVEPGTHEERTFEDGEHKIRPLQSVRGRDVYFVESLYGDDHLSVNDKILRVLFFLAAARDAGAARLTLVAPYLCYARKDRRTKPRDPVSLRYLATVIESLGVDRVVTVDVHNPAAYENAFRIPALQVQAAPLCVEALRPVYRGSGGGGRLAGCGGREAGRGRSAGPRTTVRSVGRAGVRRKISE